MGRQQGYYEPSVLHSSIALLQERFRRLEKVKEMREERQMLKLFNEPTENRSPSPTSMFELHPNWFFYPDLVHLSKPGPVVRLEPLDEPAKSQASDTSLTMSLWPNQSINTSSFSKHEDVDTTLHL